MMSNIHTAAPTVPGERQRSLDVLRGFAVLGILIMNIQSFSMISAAYLNPTAYSDLSGANLWVWIVSHVLTADKFMSIFSMLFGAGVVLMAERIEAAGGKAGRVHVRRMVWLFLFGLLHAYLIWYGDILVAYALCGMLVFLFRRLSPGKLVLAASLFFVVPILLYAMSSFSIRYWPPESYAQTLRSWLPPPDHVVRELNGMRGGWLQQMPTRATGAVFLQTFLFLFLVFWRVMAMMLLGMALYKWRVLAARRTRAFYVRLAVVGLVPGLLIVGWGVERNFAAGWTMDYSMFIGHLFNYVGSVGVALGYIALVMIAVAAGWASKVQLVLTGVGRMAFSNYILMSLLCMFIFYGNGLGLFGSVERVQQVLIVAAVWAVVLVVTQLWLSTFLYGPLEWLWRTLTYLKAQPLVAR
jgi:uncharacterized protein